MSWRPFPVLSRASGITLNPISAVKSHKVCDIVEIGTAVLVTVFIQIYDNKVICLNLKIMECLLSFGVEFVMDH